LSDVNLLGINGVLAVLAAVGEGPGEFLALYRDKISLTLSGLDDRTDPSLLLLTAEA
jgi:hypothetical protein